VISKSRPPQETSSSKESHRVKTSPVTSKSQTYKSPKSRPARFALTSIIHPSIHFITKRKFKEVRSSPPPRNHQDDPYHTVHTNFSVAKKASIMYLSFHFSLLIAIDKRDVLTESSIDNWQQRRQAQEWSEWVGTYFHFPRRPIYLLGRGRGQEPNIWYM